MTTIVTALFDIFREKHGDGRTIQEYKKWAIETVKLRCPMVIFTEESLHDFFVALKKQRKYPTEIIIYDWKNSFFFQHYDDIKRIIESPEYKNRIQYPNRIECNIPMYNVIQYTKFEWLKNVSEDNPFNSLTFCWLDMGISRFFYSFNPSKDILPWERDPFFIDGKIFVMGRSDLYSYKMDKDFLWGAANLIIGTGFGGDAESISCLYSKTREYFKDMIQSNKMNNEQLILAQIWNDNRSLFNIRLNNTCLHFPIFKV